MQQLPAVVLINDHEATGAAKQSASLVQDVKVSVVIIKFEE
jgi:hypothetical protein